MIEYFFVVLIFAMAILFILLPFYAASPFGGWNLILFSGLAIGAIFSGIVILLGVRGNND